MAAPVSPNEPIRPRWTAPLCHEDVFVQRYQWLRGWAIRLTGNLTDADDLLHDAFLQFVLRRRDLSEIANFDAYLYGLLRRLRLSQRRALLRAREDPLTVVDYDTAELSLRAAGARDTLRVRDELRQVCAYACRRKDSARSGSVLLLRFFLGFFPGEIARIMSCPLRGANDWLRIARREARACLANPTQTPYGPPPPAARANGHRADAEPVEPLDELHEMIRASRRGACLSGQALARAYGVGETERLSCRALAHVVSCPECLSRVTAMLGMRDPSDRDPHDTLRQDTSWRFRRGAPPSADGPRLAPQLRRWESSLRTVREHEARELRVAANGLPLGACRISGTDCAFTVAVNVDEPLDFIEVFSEQGVRLMLWTIEPPPAGDVDQSNRIELGGGRSLSAAVHFDAHWPSLEIAYRDPVWSIVDEAHGERGAQVLSFGQRAGARARSTLWSGLRALLDALGASPRLRPALSAIVLLAAVMVWRAPWRAEPVSAAQILADARSLEIQTASAPHLVVHRVLQIEERRLPDRAVRMRRRVEGWHSASRGVTARRVYDERGRLVTAEWIRSDGTRTIYAAGQAPRVGRTEDAPAIAASSIWQWEPSAVRFEQLAGGAAAATVREERDRYVLTYRTEPARNDDGLLEATLVVSKDARRPIAQTIVVRERGEAREFHFAETARAELPEASVADSAFEPEAELLAPVSSPAPAPPSLRIPAARPVVDPLATAHLEVDVLFALHRLESCLDAPADIAPMADGTVAVTAVAAADECRGRVRRAIDDAERAAAARWSRLGRAPPPRRPW